MEKRRHVILLVEIVLVGAGWKFELPTGLSFCYTRTNGKTKHSCCTKNEGSSTHDRDNAHRGCSTFNRYSGCSGSLGTETRSSTIAVRGYPANSHRLSKAPGLLDYQMTNFSNEQSCALQAATFTALWAILAWIGGRSINPCSATFVRTIVDLVCFGKSLIVTGQQQPLGSISGNGSLFLTPSRQA